MCIYLMGKKMYVPIIIIIFIQTAVRSVGSEHNGEVKSMSTKQESFVGGPVNHSTY